MPLNAFTGGSSSGFSRVAVSNSACSAMPLNAFTGGNSSGTAHIRVTNSSCSPAPLNAFSGGSAQGAARIGVNNSSCAPAPLNAFGGGSAQGASNIRIANSSCDPAPLNAFAGGDSGGFSRLLVSNASCDPAPLNAFAGGSSSGFDHVAEIALNPTACATLPIVLLSFQAILINDEVLITWETLTETNNDYFTIEKSDDGVDFFSIATQEGAGNSSTTLSYQVIDPNPLPGISYYRLSQTDFDGSTSYSELVVVENELGKARWSVYPNPVVDGDLYIEFNQPLANDVSLVLHDLTGREMDETIWCIESPYKIQIKVDHLAKGVYILEINLGSIVEHWRILVE